MSTPEPTPPQSDEVSLLQQLIDELKATRTENQKLQEEVNALKKTVTEDLPQGINNIVEGTKQAFEKVAASISQIKSQQEATPAAQQQQPQGGLVNQILEGITKALSTIGSNPATAAGLSDMDMEILKTSKAIQMLSLKNTFKMVAKQAGVSLPEVVEHVTLS